LKRLRDALKECAGSLPPVMAKRVLLRKLRRIGVTVEDNNGKIIN